MIYIDSSVALAEALVEDRRPSVEFWDQRIVSSRLLEFEMRNRLYAYNAGPFSQTRATDILDMTLLLDMSTLILSRALQPLPVSVRTLDGLHLATAHHLRDAGSAVELATYDARMREAAAAMHIRLAPL